jgi:hypothetical protein
MKNGYWDETYFLLTEVPEALRGRSPGGPSARIDADPRKWSAFAMKESAINEP